MKFILDENSHAPDSSIESLPNRYTRFVSTAVLAAVVI